MPAVGRASAAVCSSPVGGHADEATRTREREHVRNAALPSAYCLQYSPRMTSACLRPKARVVMVILLCVLLTSGVAFAGTSATGDRLGTCGSLRLAGLTVQSARARAAHAGCRLRLQGQRVVSPEVQTIAKQSARRVRGRRILVLWVNPLCMGSAAAGPPRGEPFATPGPTELMSGLYLAGGPLVERSVPSCSAAAGTPGAGTITVTDPASGKVVASQAVASGRLASIPLPPGTYAIVGTYANAFAGSRHLESLPIKVTIVSGRTVRQDVTVSIP